MFFAFPIAFTEIRGWGEGITGIAFVSIMVCRLAILRDIVAYVDPRSLAWYLRGRVLCANERADVRQRY